MANNAFEASPAIESYFAGDLLPLDIPPAHCVKLYNCVGSGAFGDVFRAEEVSTGQHYALKIIREKNHGWPAEQKIILSDIIERVRREASVQVNSPYVVRGFGVRQWDERTLLLLLEYFDGRPLRELLDNRNLTISQRALVIEQMLRGAHDAHQHNIIHRDLKPGNILVARNGTTKIIDFGISRFEKMPSITHMNLVFGTVNYMPPDLFFRGVRHADARSDIYAMGCIISELLTGNHPWEKRGWRDFTQLTNFASENPQGSVIEASHLSATEVQSEAQSAWPNAQIPIAQIMKRMTAVDPENRYAGVDQVLHDLGLDVPRQKAPIPQDLDLTSPVLVVESGLHAGTRTVLGIPDGGKRILGRFDLGGDDVSVSRAHVEIARQGNRFFLTDLDSTNGTMRHGQLLRPNQPIELHHDDRLQLSHLFVRFAFPKRDGTLS